MNLYGDSRQVFPHPGTGRPSGPSTGLVPSLNPELTIPPKPPPAPLVSPSPPESPVMNPCFCFSLVLQPTDRSVQQWQDPDNILDRDGSVNKYPRFSRSFKVCPRYRRCSSGCNVLYQGVCVSVWLFWLTPHDSIVARKNIHTQVAFSNLGRQMLYYTAVCSSLLLGKRL